MQFVLQPLFGLRSQIAFAIDAILVWTRYPIETGPLWV